MAPDVPPRRGLCVLIVTICFQIGVWSIKVNLLHANTLVKTSAALHVMFEFFGLEKMIGAARISGRFNQGENERSVRSLFMPIGEGRSPAAAIQLQPGLDDAAFSSRVRGSARGASCFK